MVQVVRDFNVYNANLIKMGKKFCFCFGYSRTVIRILCITDMLQISPVHEILFF